MQAAGTWTYRTPATRHSLNSIAPESPAPANPHRPQDLAGFIPFSEKIRPDSGRNRPNLGEERRSAAGAAVFCRGVHDTDQLTTVKPMIGDNNAFGAALAPAWGAEFSNRIGLGRIQPVEKFVKRVI